MTLFLANLLYTVTERDLRELLEPFGPVASLVIVRDRETGDSRGFGFAVMESEEAAKLAIESLNGIQYRGRKLAVKIAGDRPRPIVERPSP